MEWISTTWPWYISGPLIALTMAVLLYWGKSFGVSSNLRTLCSIAGAGKWNDFFKIDIKQNAWNLLFVLGGLLGGIFAKQLLVNPETQFQVSASTQADLKAQGFSIADAAPAEWFGEPAFSEPAAWAVWIIGGLLVGFGTRYAGGCTSGHAISGLSNLQLPSLIAVIGFFLGGLLMTHLLFPIIFS